MNRRSFLSNIIKAGIACAILPSAITYERKWKVIESGLIVPENKFHQLPFYLVKNELIFTDFWKEYFKFIPNYD